MQPAQVVTLAVAGCVALTFGAVPGLFHSFRLGIQNFAEALRFGPLARPRQLSLTEQADRHWGLVFVGVVLLALAAGSALTLAAQ